MKDDEAMDALRAEFERDPGLSRANPDEIWVRARVAEILEDGDRPALRALGVVPLLALDATAAVLAWTLLDPVVPLFGLALSKVLVAALAASATHTAATLGALATAGE